MRNVFAMLVITLMFIAGCDSGDVTEQEAAKVQVRLELEGLPPLQDGFTYQAWAKVGFETFPTDRFNVAENGSFVNAAGQFIQNALVFAVDVAAADEVFITIEDKRDSDDAPSGTVILGGTVSGSVATLTPTDPIALDASFAGLTGTFMVMHHSDFVAGSETSGLWFTNGSQGSPTAGLSLPALPDGWIYEGWLDTGAALISTGTFRSGSAADTASPYSSTDTPLFPGEDFLENAPTGVTFPLNPAGATARVTIEPFPDDTVDPYGFFIMSGSVPSSPTAGTPYPLGADIQMPSGTATLF